MVVRCSMFALGRQDLNEDDVDVDVDVDEDEVVVTTVVSAAAPGLEVAL